LEAWISTFKSKSAYRALNIYLNPYLRAYLNQGVLSRQLRWSWKYRLKIEFIEDEKLFLDEFRVTVHNSDVDITTAVMEEVDLDALIESAQAGDETITIPSKVDVEKEEREVKPNNRPQKNYSKTHSNKDNNSNRNRSNQSNSRKNDRNNRPNSNDRNDRRQNRNNKPQQRNKYYN
jgi:ribonuclease G